MCPRHGEPVMRRTSQTASNPGREFFLCPQGDEGCLKFAWADEFEAGAAGARGGSGRAGRGGGRAGVGGGGGREQSAGARRGARGGRSGRSGGARSQPLVASVTGQVYAAGGGGGGNCFKCGE